MKVDFPIISADSHITEAPNTYLDYIDSKYAAIAPRVVETDNNGDVYVIDGMKRSIPMGLVAAAGQDAMSLNTKAKYADLPKSGYDPTYRIADQNRDGVSAEVIYPSVGMVLCNHPDFDYKKAAMDAYNRWISEYCDLDRNRLLALGQTPMRSPEEGIQDLEKMKAMGMRGVMMPGNPQVEDYDSPVYDEFWDACTDLGLVPSFHILTSQADGLNRNRGPKMNGFLSIIRGCQDIMGMFVLGGVFERHPKLKLVCVEADAGWVPHYMYRMDHAYNRHRKWLTAKIDKLPSEYFREHIYLTFQDDFIAFRNADQMNWKRLCWANDFPHSDSTWPWSQEMLTEHTSHLTEEQRRAILCDNVAELYGIDTSQLPVGGDVLVGAKG
ncbi:MAG: amidohydrolase family protein [Acidimicrobiales bacterium]|jgi:predicted TIM-barrel fold metal-dependent hydrolase|nr:amidohydrolase family protein [Acidimicrobiales bacterium]